MRDDNDCFTDDTNGGCIIHKFLIFKSNAINDDECDDIRTIINLIHVLLSDHLSIQQFLMEV